MLRFVVLDDDYIGDDFIGQYSVAFECLQPGYRNVPLLGMAGDPLPHTSLFVHVAITNRRGGGKAQRRGLSVRRVGRRGREYVTLRNTGIKVVDETFKQASAPLKEVTDLREEAQVRKWVGTMKTMIKTMFTHYSPFVVFCHADSFGFMCGGFKIFTFKSYAPNLINLR